MSSVVRPSAGRAGHGQARRDERRGAASVSPCSRRSAGPTKSRKQATVESGLPGRPKTSVAPRRPNQSGLPGLSRTRQNSSSHAALLQRRLDVVVRADRDAAGDEQHVARRARPRPRAAVAAASSGTTGWTTTSAPAVLGQQLRASAGWTRGSGPARGAAPTSSSSVPVASTCTTGRRCTATAPTPADASAVTWWTPSARPGRREHVAAGDVLAAVAHVQPGARRQRPGVTRPSVDARVLDPQDRVGARRQRGAGRDPERRARGERVRGDVARGQLARERRARAAAPVSAARTA